MKFIQVKDQLIDLEKVASIVFNNDNEMYFNGYHASDEFGNSNTITVVHCTSEEEALDYLEQIEKLLGDNYIGRVE